MNAVILIWQEIPEALKVYDLNVTSEEYEQLIKCDGKLINVDDCSTWPADWLSSFLEDKTPCYQDTTPPDYQREISGTLIVTGMVM